MKKFAFVLVFLGASLFALGQAPSTEDLSQYASEGWHVLVDKAFAESKETGRPIMANFTGKKWCGWCKRLTSAVFEKDEFKSWAEENVVLLELDYPRRTKLPDVLHRQNAGLQQAFKVRGFPTIWVFDLDKDQNSGQYSIKALGKTGYRPTVEEFTSGVDQMIAKANAAGRGKEASTTP